MDFAIGPWRRLAARTWVSACTPANVNVGLVCGDEHTLMIDAGGHPEMGRALAASAAEMTGRPVDRLVVTHWHWDHWFGAVGVGAEQIVGHEALTTWSTHPGVIADAEEHGVTAADVAAPTSPMVLAKALDLGGTRVEIVHFGVAHTNSDIMVLVPDDNVIFAGDLLEQGSDPQFGPDSRIRTWPGALDGILGASDDDTIFVPGHGEPVDRVFAFRQRAELAMLYSESERLASRGIGWEEAVSATPWPFSEQTLRTALPLAYAELDRAGIKPGRQLPIA